MRKETLYLIDNQERTLNGLTMFDYLNADTPIPFVGTPVF